MNSYSYIHMLMIISCLDREGESNMDDKNKKEFILEGLGCANCAAKMEKRISELEGVEAATVNFVSKTLTIVFADNSDEDKLLQQVIAIVKRIEDHVKVIDKNEKKGQKVEKESCCNHCGHDNEHGHDHNHRSGHHHHSEGTRGEVIRLAIGGLIFATAYLFKFSFWVDFSLYFLCYIIVGGEVLVKAFKNIFRGEVLDENFLMCVATVGAFSVKEFPEGAAVMLFYQVGELFQNIAVNRSIKSIAALMDIRPDFANVKALGGLKRVSPEEVELGDIIVVKPGEKIPLDGKIIEGAAALDTSALTGESMPREASAGDEVLGGFINKNGVLTIEVTKKYSESTVAKILDLVENASSKKAPTENFITKFARYYTPAVVLSALALAFLPPLFISGASLSEWIYRALVFLVVSCPCALVVSIPLGFFGGIGGASKNGILVKGGNYLEALNNVDTVVFDKTGTLTKGVFVVTDIVPSGDMTEEELIEYAAYVESYSNHPIAASILKAYGKEIKKDYVENYFEISGYGIKAKVNGNQVAAGNGKLMDQEEIAYEQVNAAGTVIHVVIEGSYSGYIVIADEVKEDSAKAIKELKNLGIKNTIMLTGDNKAVGKKVGESLGIDKVYAELLPHEKVEKLEEIETWKASKGKVVFVGDGINDAPVLARADIGIAMGGVGSDAAIEAADVVIMTDEPYKIAVAMKIAKRTRKIVWQNIVFALGVKAIILILGALGYATMWEAVFGDVGVALIAVLNAMRAMRV